MAPEADPMLRRVERGSVVACAVMAAIAAAVASRPVAAALGVVAGGGLVAISYRGIKAGVDALVGAAAGRGGSRMRTAVGLVKFFTRYAILAVAAYVIMARLELPAVSVVAGASSFVIAVMFEAVRSFRDSRRSQRTE